MSECLNEYKIEDLHTPDLTQDQLEIRNESYTAPGMRELIREAGAESIVLLENDGTLPLDPHEMIAVFGRCQSDWIRMGYGSGGDLYPSGPVSLIDGLENAGIPYDRELAESYRSWAALPDHKADPGTWLGWNNHFPEMQVPDELLHTSAERCSTALIVIGRGSGEGHDCTPEKGSFYLTDEEILLLTKVSAAFRHTVVILNLCNLIDLSPLEMLRGKISALLLAYPGGMESGNAVCDVLFGKTAPSGRLCDSIARSYQAYPSSVGFGDPERVVYSEGIFMGYRYFDRFAPEQVLYPFGYGLSYAEFQIRPETFQYIEETVQVSVTVSNTGSFRGKEVLKLFCCPPVQGLEKPARILAAFAKTGELAPGASETLTLRCPAQYFSSYDEERHIYLLEPGTWSFELNGVPAGSFTLEEEVLIREASPAMMPDSGLKERILSSLPEEIRSEKTAGEKLFHFSEVIAGTLSPDDFIASLSVPELEALTRGHGMMNSSYGPHGNAGAFGGIIPELNEKGVPPVVVSDGPSGIRLGMHTSQLPSASALACTWNTGLTEVLYLCLGEELQHWGIDLLLGPGMNLHRNPLCGRNFEYYSEDPLLSGMMAAAAVRGIQRSGKAACIKHLACNNQETGRNTCDGRISERTLRELYLRNFEICIRESAPLTVMSSYNKVNGIWSHYNYDLFTTILRDEWNWCGTVLTDWWMQPSASPEFPALRDNAYRVRSQVDVLMPGDMDHSTAEYVPDSSLTETLGQEGGITLAELQRSARNVLNLILNLKKPAF